MTNTAPLSQLMLECVSGVLETMFFTSAEPDVEGKEIDFNGSIASRLHFCGEPTGSLAVILPTPSANRLAAAFLGLEEDEIGPAQREQTVHELANMICGAMVSRLRSDGLFELTSPVAISPAEALASEPGRPALQHSFAMDEGSITVVLAGDQPW